MTVRLLVLLSALAGWTGAAAAQDRRLADRLDSAVAGRIEAIVDSAKSERLPTEPLVQKALEGVAKQVPGDRIVAAVAALHRALGRARAAIGGPAE